MKYVHFYKCILNKIDVQNNIDYSVKELHIFSDSCGGQNRNHTVIRFFLAFAATGRFEKILHYFHVHGSIPSYSAKGSLRRVRDLLGELTEFIYQLIMSC